jgi:MFS family permease
MCLQSFWDYQVRQYNTIICIYTYILIYAHVYFYTLKIITGMFAATFPITFAYISDVVGKQKRAPIYGLALATFGLSFCIGPVTGSYIAAKFGSHIVFLISLLLVVGNVVYIMFVLPETSKRVDVEMNTWNSKLGAALAYLPNTWKLSETFRIFRYTCIYLYIFIYERFYKVSVYLFIFLSCKICFTYLHISIYMYIFINLFIYILTFIHI